MPWNFRRVCRDLSTQRFWEERWRTRNKKFMSVYEGAAGHIVLEEREDKEYAARRGANATCRIMFRVSSLIALSVTTNVQRERRNRQVTSTVNIISMWSTVKKNIEPEVVWKACNVAASNTEECTTARFQS